MSVRDGIVAAVSQSRSHAFSKRPQLAIRLVAGLGVEGDAHQGITVKYAGSSCVS